MADRSQNLFWNRFREEMRFVALSISRSRNAYWSEADEFAQEAVMVAVNFIQTKSNCIDPAPEVLSQWREEAYAYALKALDNSFNGRRRQDTRRAAIREYYAQDLEEHAVTGSRIPKPDEGILFREAREVVEDIAGNSRSPDYQKIAAAIPNHTDGSDFDDIDAKDLAKEAGVPANKRLDLARQIEKKTSGTLR